MFERQAEFGAEFFQRQHLHAALLKDKIGRRQNSRQIIHQSAGPIKDDVPNHCHLSYGKPVNIKPKTEYCASTLFGQCC